MGPGYDIHFDCAAFFTDDLWLMERRRRAAAFDGSRELTRLCFDSNGTSRGGAMNQRMRDA